MSRAKWLCLDCGADTGKIGEHYFVKDDIWLPVAPKKGMLCVQCLENRLGRTLCATDFTPSYINRSGNKSLRLEARIGAR